MVCNITDMFYQLAVWDPLSDFLVPFRVASFARILINRFTKVASVSLPSSGSSIVQSTLVSLRLTLFPKNSFLST